MNTLRSFWLGVALVLSASAVNAQQGIRVPAASQAPAAPQAQQRQDPMNVDPNSIVMAAVRTAQLVDAGKAGEAWDGASAVAKRAIAKDAFVKQVVAARAPLGAAQTRAWWAVTRQVVNAGGQAPAGNYMSVRLLTRFASGRTVAELVSFRLDEDGMWRVAGYTVQ